MACVVIRHIDEPLTCWVPFDVLLGCEEVGQTGQILSGKQVRTGRQEGAIVGHVPAMIHRYWKSRLAPSSTHALELENAMQKLVMIASHFRCVEAVLSSHEVGLGLPYYSVCR